MTATINVCSLHVKGLVGELALPRGYQAKAQIVRDVEKLSRHVLRAALSAIGIRSESVRSRDEIALIRYRIDQYEHAEAMKIFFSTLPVIEHVRWTINAPFSTEEIENLFPTVEPFSTATP